MDYAKTIRLRISHEEAVPLVREAFAQRGFGTLTEIDVRATLEEKLGVQVDPYLIIGACNPRLAHRALQIEPKIGVFLPCNVVVRKDGDGVIIDALDPAVMASVPENPALLPLADEAARLVGEALDALAGGSGVGST